MSVAADRVAVMLTQALADATRELAAVGRDTLAELASRAEQHAQAKGLTVLPATVDAGDTVVLDPDRLTVEQVVDAAAASGAALLYLARDTVRADVLTADLPLPDPDDTDAVAAHKGLRKALTRIDGWTGQVQVAFAHGGVLHVWSTAADWFDTVEQLDDPPAGRRTAAWGDGDDDVPVFLDDAVLERLVEELIAHEPFRRTDTRADRTAAARTLPALAEVLDDEKLKWQGGRVVDAATRRLVEQGEQAALELQPRIAEFAAELAAVEGFAAGHTAEVRQRVAADWITRHTDGLRMPRWWVKELEATARPLRSRPGRSSGQMTL